MLRHIYIITVTKTNVSAAHYTNFCRHEIYRTYQWENRLTTTNCACKDLVRKPSFPVTLTKGGS